MVARAGGVLALGGVLRVGLRAGSVAGIRKLGLGLE